MKRAPHSPSIGRQLHRSRARLRAGPERAAGGPARARAARGLLVATKVPAEERSGRPQAGVPVAEVVPGRHMPAVLREEPRNLGMSAVDLLQLHVWRTPGWTRAAMARRWTGLNLGEGALPGVSINDHDPRTALRAVSSGLFDAVQVIYNVFDPRPGGRALPACRKHEWACSRASRSTRRPRRPITPESTFPAGDFRNEYFAGDRRREVYERGRGAHGGHGRRGRLAPRAGARFCLSRRRGLHRDSRHAPRVDGRGERGRLRRAPAFAGAPHGAPASRLGAELLRLSFSLRSGTRAPSRA